jgi:hypothetical protein
MGMNLRAQSRVSINVRVDFVAEMFTCGRFKVPVVSVTRSKTLFST